MNHFKLKNPCGSLRQFFFPKRGKPKFANCTLCEDSSTDKENNEENEEPRANIAPIMKSKRIVVPMKTVPVQEAADMEMSFATKKNLNKVKVAKKKVETFKKPLDPSPDVTIDCSILAPRPTNRNHVFSTPVYQKFKTNHIRNASDSH